MIVFYAPTVLEQDVGLERTMALIVSGCIQFCFVVGSIVPAWGLDKLGRRKLMMLGSFGMALSMMMVAILLSFHGTAKQAQTSQASIAFLITVQSLPLHPFIFCQLTKGIVHALLWCQSRSNSLVLQC